jgi:ribosome biogenesis protein Tsr3
MYCSPSAIMNVISVCQSCSQIHLQRLLNGWINTKKCTHARTHARNKATVALFWFWVRVIVIYVGVRKSFRTESVMKYTLTIINTRWEATQKIMAAELTRLTHRTIQPHLVAESFTICSSRSRRPVRNFWIHPRKHRTPN